MNWPSSGLLNQSVRRQLLYFWAGRHKKSKPKTTKTIQPISPQPNNIQLSISRCAALLDNHASGNNEMTRKPGYCGRLIPL